MVQLRYVGKPVENDTGNPAQGTDLVDLDYLNTLLAANMSQGAVTSRINSNLSGFATASYATSAMSGLATPAYVHTQDATYVPLTSIGAPNGPVPLSTLGQVSPGLINAPSTQQFPTPLYSPSGYQSAPVTTDSPEQIFTVAQPYPGYNYRLQVTGIMDGQVPFTDDPTCFPEVLIYEGSLSGPIIAFGYGVGESYTWGHVPLGVQSNTRLGDGSEWAQYYSSTTQGFWATTTAGIATWVGDTVGAATCRCRNLDPVFGKTTTDYQQISITIGSTLISNDAADNDIYARMDETGTYYVRCIIGADTATLWYSLGSSGPEVQITGTMNGTIAQATGNVYTLVAGNATTANPRQFQLYQQVGSTQTLVATWNDTANATALGSSYRGWGFGASVGGYFFFFFPFEAVPSSITAVTIVDPADPAISVNSGEIVILPTPLVNQTTQTGPTTLYVVVQSSDQSAVTKEVSVSTLFPGLAITPIPWAA